MSDPDARARARERLAAFLPAAAEDAVIDDQERAELLAILTSGVLTKADVQDVFRAFLQSLGRDALADGVLTPEERDRIRFIVTALSIPQSFLPPELAAILSEDG
jgi:uncharacterized membrane protein YebE (DUF533 family)